MPAAITANGVIRGERGEQVGVESRDAARLEAAQALAGGWRYGPRGVIGRLGVPPAVRGRIVVQGEHLGQVVRQVIRAAGGVPAKAMVIGH
jgi:hypothetical protein